MSQQMNAKRQYPTARQQQTTGGAMVKKSGGFDNPFGGMDEDVQVIDGIPVEDAPEDLVSKKIVSIELSNSQGKRFDGVSDPLIVQSAWTYSIDRDRRRTGGTNTSPILSNVSPRKNTVWFGELPAEGEHESVANNARTKSEMGRFLLRPLLLPGDDDIKVVMSYHSLFDSEAMDRFEKLKGYYTFRRNGVDIMCNVSDIEFVREGMGAYWLGIRTGNLQANLKTLVVELGYRTSEVWIINNGKFVKGAPIEELGVYNLARQIADDDNIRASVLGSATTSSSVNPSQIAMSLKSGRLAKTPRWLDISHPYISRWKDKVVGRIMTDYSTDLNTIEQAVFSGGGAMLIRDDLIESGFHVDEQADTASVRGTYYHAIGQ